MGAPSISGGMTYAEQQKALKEEREFNQAQEDKRREQAIREERDREERDRLAKEKLAQEEAKRIADINAAEQAVIDEAKAQGTKAAKKESKTSISFFDALAKGISSSTEKPK